MEVRMEAIAALGRAEFSPEKMSKSTLAESERILVGLNCFRPGQEHAVHTHAGQDKLYHVLSGRGEFQVGDDRLELGAGELVLVPGGVPHGAACAGDEDLVVMVVMSPPPSRRV